MVKRSLYIFFLITVLLLVITQVYKVINLTDLQKIVKKNGFEHFNSSQTIYDSYRWFEEDNVDLFCNNLISIEVYDIYPTTITYSCVTLDEDGFTEFVYDYGTNTDKLSIGSGDFSHPSETVKDKELYEKVYNEEKVTPLSCTTIEIQDNMVIEGTNNY